MALPQTTPPWVALTAYLVGGRVTPVTPNATSWYATTNGTSGAMEPTWPTTDPWTVVDGGVTWGLASSARALFVSELYNALVSFRAANPTLLAGVLNARPKSLSNASLPVAWVGSRNETLVHTGALRTRTFSGLTVEVADTVPDNDQAEARMDILIDGLMDLFTATFRNFPTAITQQASVTEVSLDDRFPGLIGNIIGFGPTFVTEGRD
jgi:hypothetical protein